MSIAIELPDPKGGWISRDSWWPCWFEGKVVTLAEAVAAVGPAPRLVDVSHDVALEWREDRLRNVLSFEITHRHCVGWIKAFRPEMISGV